MVYFGVSEIIFKFHKKGVAIIWLNLCLYVVRNIGTIFVFYFPLDNKAHI